MAGEFDSARRMVAEAVAADRSLDRPLHHAGNGPRCIGTVEFLAGDLTAAEQALRRGYEQLVKMRDRPHATFVGTELARILYLQDRLADAERIVKKHSTTMRHEIPIQTALDGLRAVVMGRRGRHDEALGLARAVVAMADATDVTTAIARAHEDFGEVLEMAGRREEALSEVACALEAYEKKGVTVLAQRLRRRLARGSAASIGDFEPL
jgi:tetratricopeptide (TPR) repeat protein